MCKYSTKTEYKQANLGFCMVVIRCLEINSCCIFFLIMPFYETTKTLGTTFAAAKKTFPFLILRDNRFAKSDSEKNKMFLLNHQIISSHRL